MSDGGDWSSPAPGQAAEDKGAEIAVDILEKLEGYDLELDDTARERIYEAAARAKVELETLEQTDINLPFLATTEEGPVHLEVRYERGPGRQSKSFTVKGAQRIAGAEDVMQAQKQQMTLSREQGDQLRLPNDLDLTDAERARAEQMLRSTQQDPGPAGVPAIVIIILTATATGLLSLLICAFAGL